MAREERRLAAIVSADVVGYSRLMGVDESGTLAALRSHRAELIDPLIAEHGGRIVKTMGDGLLLEFPSVVNATRCAIEFQQGMAERNDGVPEDKRIVFRIGINLGDIIIDGEDIFGDGVNVAARLQEVSAPGGLALAGVAYESIGSLVDVTFEDGGDQQFKNIARPIRVWRWAPDMTSPPAVSPRTDEPLPLPDKPSIAVLPFVNISGDPEQEYFSDGISEDIITALSRFRSLFVIARNSVFAYKDKSPDVREVARDLGVRYILEGSVRRGGKRIRITGQLIDAATGNHLWAERYDRELEDIFAVQDEVTEAIVGAIAPEIGEVERARSQRKPVESLDAWDHYQRALAGFYTSTAEGYRSAIEQFDRVNDIDPTFAPAFAMTALARALYILHFEPDDRDEILNQAREKARNGTALDPRDPTCLRSDGRVHSMLGHHDVAISKVEEAVALNPNDAMSQQLLGVVLSEAGRAEEALPHFDHAIRLSPRDIFLTGMLTYRAFVLFDLKRYEEAFEGVQRASLNPNPRTMTFALLTVVSTKLGRREEARHALDDLLAHAPGTSCVKFRKNPMFGSPEAMERFVDTLREAGLPE